MTSKYVMHMFPADLVTFMEEIIDEKLHFLWSAWRIGFHYEMITRNLCEKKIVIGSCKNSFNRLFQMKYICVNLTSVDLTIH